MPGIPAEYQNAADGILLILSAPVMIGAVQMITWLSGKRNKSVNYLGSLLKRLLPYLL